MQVSNWAARYRWLRLLKLTLLFLLIVAANFVTSWVTDALEFDLRPSNEDIVHRTIMIAAIVYALLIAIPFVPGVEVGLALIAVLGPQISFLVYVSTVVGLYSVPGFLASIAVAVCPVPIAVLLYGTQILPG